MVAQGSVRVIMRSNGRPMTLSVRTHCKRGHAYPPGVTRCATCRQMNDATPEKRAYFAQRQRNRTNQRYAGGLVVGARSFLSAVRIASWNTRRERYGKAGRSPEKHAAVMAKMAAARRAQRGLRRQAFCKRGHSRRPENIKTIFHHGRWEIVCKVCARIRKKGNRPEWAQVDGVKVNVAIHDRHYLTTRSRLLARVIETHPDRGGRTVAAGKAIDALRAFEKRERKWYRALSLDPPARKTAIAA